MSKIKKLTSLILFLLILILASACRYDEYTDSYVPTSPSTYNKETSTLQNTSTNEPVIVVPVEYKKSRVVYLTYNISSSYPTVGILKTSNLNGGDETILYNGAAFPALSPDKKKVAFISVDNDNKILGLCIINIDGSGFENLTGSRTGPNNEILNMFYPSWSPDQRHIAFISYTDNNLYVININTKKILKLTKYEYNSGELHSPSWSPDGRYISFSRYFNLNFNIFKMRVDKVMNNYNQNDDNNCDKKNKKKNKKNKKNHNCNHGKRHACKQSNEHGNDTNNQNIENQNPEITQITFDRYNNHIFAKWISNSKLVYQKTPYSSYDNKNNQICTINSDGTNNMSITGSGKGVMYPVWHSQSGKIIYIESTETLKTYIKAISENGLEKTISKLCIISLFDIY